MRRGMRLSSPSRHARGRGTGAVAASCILAAALASAAVPALVAPAEADVTSSGVATMLDDGTVLLQLRAGGPGGIIGDALLRYPPSDPNYAAVRAHLPTLRPGHPVPVPPFR